jgi:hypothetical protein
MYLSYVYIIYVYIYIHMHVYMYYICASAATNSQVRSGRVSGKGVKFLGYAAALHKGDRAFKHRKIVALDRVQLEEREGRDGRKGRKEGTNGRDGRTEGKEVEKGGGERRKG